MTLRLVGVLPAVSALGSGEGGCWRGLSSCKRSLGLGGCPAVGVGCDLLVFGSRGRAPALVEPVSCEIAQSFAVELKPPVEEGLPSLLGISLVFCTELLLSVSDRVIRGHGFVPLPAKAKLSGAVTSLEQKLNVKGGFVSLIGGLREQRENSSGF